MNIYIILDRTRSSFLKQTEIWTSSCRSKAQPRFLLIGNSYLHNVKGQKLGKIKERRKIPIASLKSLSLSPFHDNYLFIHVNSKDGADLMYEVDQKTEIVRLLQKLYVLYIVSCIKRLNI